MFARIAGNWKAVRRYAALLVGLMAAVGLLWGMARADAESVKRLREAVRQLTAEGVAIRDGKRELGAQPDFAGRFGGDGGNGSGVDPADVARALNRRQHRDGFVDAYVRWQLTSFGGRLGEMDDKAFARFLDGLPKLDANPFADEKLIEEVQTAVKVESPTDLQREKAGQRVAELRERTAKAVRMNTPAMGLRDWVVETGAVRMEHVLLAGVERLRAVAEAGWPVGEARGVFDALVKKAAGEVMLDDAARERVIAAMTALERVQRLYVSRLDVTETGLRVEYGDAVVDDFEVRRWARVLRRRGE